MNPIHFKHSNITLQPRDTPYPAYVTTVGPLPIWTDGEMCLSCWQMTLRERLSALLFGRVWISVLSGYTQPSVSANACKTFFKKGANHD